MEELNEKLQGLKIEQKKILKEKNLNVAKLNEINKEMFSIRQEMKRLKIKETDEIGLYIY